MVITIGCEYGSGGPEIGRQIAEELGIEYYDRDLVDKVVEQIGVDRELVEKADEGSNVKYEFETKLGPRFANLTNRVIYTQFEVIKKMAENESCVIIGRCSDYILKDRDDCLNIFIYAPDDVRVKTIMEKEKVSKKVALELMKKNDEMLHERYMAITGSNRGDRKNRDILINSNVLGWDMTVKYLLQLIELRFSE